MGRYSRKNRGGWGGSVEFDYEVERYKDKESGELYTETQVEEIGGDIDSKYEGVTINLSIEGSAHYTPGYTSGLPENCYSDDSDSEIEKITDSDGKNWSHLITDDEEQAITELLVEKAQDIAADEYECAGDDAYDRWKDDRDSGYDY